MPVNLTMLNCNCDGSGPHSGPEVRVLPWGDGPYHGNSILCYRCYLREMRFRKERNRDLSADCQFKLPQWDDLKVYENA